MEITILTKLKYFYIWKGEYKRKNPPFDINYSPFKITPYKFTEDKLYGYYSILKNQCSKKPCAT